MVAVTYTVRAPTPAQLQFSGQALNFTLTQGTAAPLTQAIAISNPGESVLNWRTQATTLNGGSWLSVAPSLGTNNGSAVVIVNGGSLAQGVYVGRVAISADQVANSPAPVQVNLTVSRGTPSLDGGGFVSAASLKPDGVVAGSLATIFGARLGPAVGIAYSRNASSPKPPFALGGTRVTFDAVPAPLFYASDGQVNLQIPMEEAGKASANVTIEADGYDPAQFKINLAPSNVSLFSTDGTRAAAFNQDGSVNGTSTPAPLSSIVQFYATGQGALNIPVATDDLAPARPRFPFQ